LPVTATFQKSISKKVADKNHMQENIQAISGKAFLQCTCSECNCISSRFFTGKSFWNSSPFSASSSGSNKHQSFIIINNRKQVCGFSNVLTTHVRNNNNYKGTF